MVPPRILISVRLRVDLDLAEVFAGLVLRRETPSLRPSSGGSPRVVGGVGGATFLIRRLRLAEELEGVLGLLLLRLLLRGGSCIVSQPPLHPLKGL